MRLAERRQCCLLRRDYDISSGNAGLRRDDTVDESDNKIVAAQIRRIVRPCWQQRADAAMAGSRSSTPSTGRLSTLGRVSGDVARVTTKR